MSQYILTTTTQITAVAFPTCLQASNERKMRKHALMRVNVKGPRSCHLRPYIHQFLRLRLHRVHYDFTPLADLKLSSTI